MSFMTNDPSVLGSKTEHACFTASGRRAAVETFAFCIPAYRLVHIVVGLVLVTAACLKTHQWVTDPSAEFALASKLGLSYSVLPWLVLALIEVELLLGLWLLSGLAQAACRLATLALFATFAFANLYLAGTGATSCGCFGKLALSPWYAFAIDACALATLFQFRPTATSPLRLWESFRVRGPRLAFAHIALVSAVGLAVPVLRSQPASLSDTGTLLADGRIVLLEPEKWLGKRLPLLPYIDIGAQLSRVSASFF
jgi:hypothetical protein